MFGIPDSTPSLALNLVSCVAGTDPEAPGPPGLQAPATAPTHPGPDSSDKSSEDMGEGTSEGGNVLASASTSQLTIPDTDT